MQIPTGVDTLSFNYNEIGDSFVYSHAPQVIVSMRVDEQSQFFYAHSTYNVTPSGFNVAFSDKVIESGNYLDISINRD